MVAYLYSIINKINGHRYIGKTFNIERRKKQHLSALKKDLADNYYSSLKKDCRA